MAAVVAPIPIPTPGPAPARRPHLRVIPGGRSARPSPGVLLRRRLVAVALLALVVVALVVAASRVVDLLAVPGPTGSPAVPAVDVPVPATDTYVVRAGDTLWGIASSLQPEGDVRPVVDELAQRLGGAVLQPGQRIDVSSLVG